MGQKSGTCLSSSDGSDASKFDSSSSVRIVVPSPVLPSSDSSPELGFPSRAGAPHVSGFDEEGPPDMVPSSDEEEYELFPRRSG